MRADAQAARSFVDDQAFQVGAETFDERLVGGDRSPSDDAIATHRHKDRAPLFQAVQASRNLSYGYFVSQLSHERRDSRGVVERRGPDLERLFIHLKARVIEA